MLETRKKEKKTKSNQTKIRSSTFCSSSSPIEKKNRNPYAILTYNDKVGGCVFLELIGMAK
jgi:hypothetical protein